MSQRGYLFSLFYDRAAYRAFYFSGVSDPLYRHEVFSLVQDYCYTVAGLRERQMFKVDQIAPVVHLYAFVRIALLLPGRTEVIFNINFDMTGVTLGYEHVCCSCSEETMHAIQYLANVENYPLDIELGMYSSDSSSFAGAGVPACTFARLNPRGGAQIHNHHDTMEHLDPDSFMITANFVAKFASQIANSTVNPIPRKFADKVKKALEERKRFMPGADKEEKKPSGKKDSKKTEKK